MTPDDLYKKLIRAIKKNDLELVRELLAKGPYVREGYTFFTPEIIEPDVYLKTSLLVHACKHGNREIQEELLDTWRDVNSIDTLGSTALMYACTLGNVDSVRILLDRGANISIKDPEGKTVLMYALQQGNLEIAEILLDRGADMSIKNPEGKTVFSYFIEGIPRNNKHTIEEFKQFMTSFIRKGIRPETIFKEINRIDNTYDQKTGPIKLDVIIGGINRVLASLWRTTEIIIPSGSTTLTRSAREKLTPEVLKNTFIKNVMNLLTELDKIQNTLNRKKYKSKEVKNKLLNDLDIDYSRNSILLQFLLNNDNVKKRKRKRKNTETIEPINNNKRLFDRTNH